MSMANLRPMPQGRTIILITTSFPYGEGEPFLHLESEYLRRWFDRVVVVHQADGTRTGIPRRTVLDGAEVVSADVSLTLWDRFAALGKLISDADVRDELRTVRTVYGMRPGWGTVKTMLVSKAKAERLLPVLGQVAKAEAERGHEVWAYSYWCMEGALAAAMLARTVPGVHAVTRAHAWDVYFERSSYGYLPFRKLILQQVDAAFFISENARKYMLALLPGLLDPQRMVNARLGIRTSDVSTQFSRQYRSFRIVSCSYLIPIKRIERLIEAIALIDGFDVEWTHFGDGPLMPQLLTKAQQILGGKANIRYTFRGRVPNWEILQYYAHHPVDVFVSVSRYDGIPVSIMEAMSFGIPAIATDVGGVGEIVRHGSTGILLADDPTPADVARAIRSVSLMGDEELTEMRANARSMWGQYYNADVNYTHFCEALICLQRPVTSRV